MIYPGVVVPIPLPLSAILILVIGEFPFLFIKPCYLLSVFILLDLGFELCVAVRLS